MITRRLLAATSAAALGSLFCAPHFGALAQEKDPAAPAVPDAVAPHPSGLDKAARVMGHAQEAFASHLIMTMAKSAKGQNIIVSPLSATAALAIVSAGSDKALLHSMRQTLKLPATGDDAALFGNLLADIKAYSEADAKSPLAVANRILIDPASEPNAAMLVPLAANGVETAQEDLSDPANIAKINDWVKQKTRDLIPSILDQPPGKGSLVALNALYFKDKWQSPFDAARTQPLPFNSTDGKKDPVPMMAQEGTLRFRHEGDLIGADLGFADKRFSLVVVTTISKPEEATALTKAAQGWLGGEKFSESMGSLKLPRLQMEGSNDLLAPLQHLGFKPEPNSLRGFAAKPPALSAVLQKAVLKLDEEGAEAAAATAIVATRSVASGEVHMVVDKPFVFALRDRSTGFVVMAGYVARPGG